MSRWIVCPYPRSHPKLRLLCFPYAGGSAWIFRAWAQQLPDTIEVCAIELPGRGKRMAEPTLNKVPIHTLPDTDFINKLKRYEGIPESILNNAEMMAFVLPILRADFTVLETYKYQPSAPKACPITGFWGQQDTIVNQEHVAAWDIHTHSFTLEAIEGDHFFLQQPSFPNRLLPHLA